MAIFTDKRELPVQAKYQQFTGKKNLLGKIGGAVGWVPGLDLIGNELEAAGSTGDLKKQYQTTGREHALANTIQTATAATNIFAPGTGTLAKMATGIGSSAAQGALRGRRKGDAAVEDAVTTTEDLEKTGSALAEEIIKEGETTQAQEALNASVDELDADAILSDDFDNIDIAPVIDDTKSAGDIMAEAGTPVDDIAEGTGELAKGGKFQAGVDKLATGKFAKGVGQAAGVANIAGDVAGVFMGKAERGKTMERERQKIRSTKLTNQRYSNM